jgi:ribosomal protein L29
MIVFKNGKIIAIDKTLLKNLNATLEELSDVISQMQLQILSLKNEPLSLKNKKIEIKEIEILSIEDIKIFETKVIESSVKEELEPELKTFEPEIKPLEIEPKIEEPQEIKFDYEPAPIEPEEIKFDYETPQFEPKLEEPAPKTQPEEKKELNLEISPQEINKEITPPTVSEEEKPQEFSLQNEPQEIEPVDEGMISISFEDEFSEIDTLLNLPPKEASKQIEEELKKAAEDLSIDIDTIYELKDELFEMFKTEKEKLLKTIEDKNYDEIHKTAHKLKGAALNLRLSNIAMILKKIDEISKSKKDIHKIKYLTDKFYDFIEKIEAQKPKPKIPKEIKDLILITIQNYLETQNEKQFKKDKKYIEKLLNVKIDSIEDLQQILKES